MVLLKDLEIDHPHFSVLRDRTTNRSALFNQAVADAKGKWLLFVESHCIMRRDWLKKYLLFLENQKDQIVRGNIKDLPNGSWIGKTEEIIRNQIETARNLENKTAYYLDFHHTAFLRELYLSIGGLDSDLWILGEFELGARLHNLGYTIGVWNEILVWHKNDTALSSYMKNSHQHGKDTMRVFQTHGSEFATKYFPNPIFRRLSIVRNFPGLLLNISRFLNVIGFLGCNILQALKCRKAYNCFFSLYGKNIHRTGMLQEYKNHG